MLLLIIVLPAGPRDAPSAEICFLEAPLFQSFNVEIFTKVFICLHCVKKIRGSTGNINSILLKEKGQKKKGKIP